MSVVAQFPVNTCEIHSAEELVVYCKRCLDPICVQCIHGDHFGHEYEGLAKIARETKAKIPEICEEIRKSDISKLEQNVEDFEKAISESDTNYQKENEKIQKFRDTFERLSSQVFNRMIEERRSKNEKCMAALNKARANATKTKENLEERMRGHEENRFNYSSCDVMEVMKQLKIIVGDIKIEDPSENVYHDQANDNADDDERVQSEIERVIHDLLLPRATKDWFNDDRNIIAIGNSLPQDEYLALGCLLGMKAQEVELIYKECAEDLRHLMPTILLQWRKKCSNKDEETKLQELLSVLRDLGLDANATKVEDMYKRNKPMRDKDF